MVKILSVTSKNGSSRELSIVYNDSHKRATRRVVLFFTVSVPGLTFLGAKGISNRMVGRLTLYF